MKFYVPTKKTFQGDSLLRHRLLRVLKNYSSHIRTYRTICWILESLVSLKYLFVRSLETLRARNVHSNALHELAEEKVCFTLLVFVPRFCWKDFLTSPEIFFFRFVLRTHRVAMSLVILSMSQLVSKLPTQSARLSLAPPSLDQKVINQFQRQHWKGTRRFNIFKCRVLEERNVQWTPRTMIEIIWNLITHACSFN